MRLILISILLLFGICIGIIAGFSRPENTEFTFVSGAEPESLDPALITGAMEARIAGGLFEGLTTSNPKDLTPEPGIARGWTLSEDGLEYIFFLRRAEWSNGDPLTANDFVYSWKRVLTPETAADYAYQLYYIKNARLFNEGMITDFEQVGVRALDDYRLQIILAQPTPFFLNLTSFPTLFPVNKGCVEKYGDDWTRPENIVTNGPFCLKEWRVNQHIIMVKNPRYWDKENVGLNRIKALTVEGVNTGFNIYWTGAADFITAVPLTLVDVLKGEKDFHTNIYLATYFYRFNVKKKPFDDVRVRKALNMAVNKEEIVRFVTKGGEIPARSFIPPGMPGYNPAEGLAYNIEAAQGLLAEAGYPDGAGFPVVELLYNTSEANKDIAEVIQQMWKKNLNINVTLINQEWKVFLSSTRKMDYQISRASWIGDYIDPNTFLDMFVTDGGNNRTGWSNAEYDALIKEAAMEIDKRKRMQLFRKAEKILIEDELPIMPLYFYVSYNMYRDNVKGIFPNMLNMHSLKHIRVE